MQATNSALEHIIVAAILKDRKSYELFERIGDKDAIGPIGSLIFRAAQEYYRDDRDAGSCSLELIEARVIRGITNAKHHSAVRSYLGNLPASVSGPAIEREIAELHRSRVGSKLSLALANGSSNEDIQALIADYNKVTVYSNANKTDLVDVLDTSDLTEDKPNVDYIKLWPKTLNDRLDGGVLRGHHILLFARPETGKTLFTINMVAGFLHQGLSVLYVGNEEPTADIRDRIRGRLLKWSKSDVRSRRSEAAERLQSAALGGIAITQETSFGAVRACLVRESGNSGNQVRQQNGTPDVVIFDQVRNMRIKSDGRTAELEAAGIEARAIAKDYNVLVISITQAGDSATNKVYLEMSDVDSSKTGLAASADLMIGLGSDPTMQANGLMGVSLTKNKLSGLHDKFTVTANFSTGVIS